MRLLLKEIWLEVNDLVDAGVKENTIYFGIKTSSPRWQAIPDPEDRRKRLIKFDTLANRYKEQVCRELYGGLTPKEWLVMQEEAQKLETALDKRDSLLGQVEDLCEEGYKRYLHLYRGATDRQQRVLSRAAGIIDLAGRWYQANGLPWKSYEPVNEIAAWVEKNQGEYFYLKYLPTNPIRLKEKVTDHWVKGKPLHEVISLPRSGNDNRATRKKDMWWQSIAIHLKLTGRLQNDRAVFRKIREVAEIESKECPSETTVTSFLRDTRYLTADKQYDLNNKGRQRHRASMPIAKPMFSDDCWEMDGTRVQFMAHRAGEKELRSLYIVAVRDVYSGAYLGYWYGYSESEHAYRSALKMAVDLTGRLPYELRFDKFPGSTSAGWKYLAGEKDKKGRTLTEGQLEKHGVKLTCTSESTGKASAERAFYTLQQVFESENKAYIGQGIRSSTANARPTELYVSRVWKSLLANGWDYDQAWMSHAEQIAAFNHTEYSKYSKKYAKLHLSPWQMYEQSESSGRTIGMLEIAELFWNARNEGVRNNRIEFTDRGNRYRYDIKADNYELISTYQKPNVQVVVRHDPFDFSSIMVFSAGGEFLAQIQEQKDIQLYGKNADWKAATEWRENKKDLEKRKAADLNQYTLPDEMAVLLPTVASKQVYNDAQREYAYSNAGTWQAESPAPPARKTAKHPTGPIDLDSTTRGNY